MPRIQRCLSYVAFRTCIMLALAVATTIAVSWACSFNLNKLPLAGAVVDPLHGSYVCFMDRGASLLIQDTDVDGLPVLSDVELPATRIDSHVICIMVAGWPFRAMEWRVEMSPHEFIGPHRLEQEGSWSWGPMLELSYSTSVNDEMTHQLPQVPVNSMPLWIRPLPFAINSLLYFVLWLGVIKVAAFGLKEARRGWYGRNRCANCGYSRVGISGACPECGLQESNAGGR
jgi:hypothetical protein